MDDTEESVNLREKKSAKTHAPRVLGWDRFLTLAAQEAHSHPAKNQLKLLIGSENWAPTLETAQTPSTRNSRSHAFIGPRGSLGSITGT
jgi:hypothetical protein